MPLLRILPLALLPLTLLGAAEPDQPEAGLGLPLTWTLGAHLSSPLGPAVAAAGILGPALPGEARGLTLLAEPGLSGGKLGIGYSDLHGSAAGPYLIERWRGWAHDPSFLWPRDGWSARGVLVRSWGPDLGIPQGRTFAGGEVEGITTLAPQAPWGGLHGVNLTLGLVTNLDHGTAPTPIRAGHEWRVLVEAGVGF